ncbi:hypothetical protein MZA93_00535, partial [Haemophilus influenzae]
GDVRKQEIVQQVENMIRCAFRENNNYGVTRTYPFSRFSWSKLGEEIHDNINEIASMCVGAKRHSKRVIYSTHSAIIRHSPKVRGKNENKIALLDG